MVVNKEQHNTLIICPKKKKKKKIAFEILSSSTLASCDIINILHSIDTMKPSCITSWKLSIRQHRKLTCHREADNLPLSTLGISVE